MIIDAQVHAYERDHPDRPWAADLAGPREVTGDDMVAAMDEVGVDGALLVSPWTLYRDDASYALEVLRDHGDRFALIAPFDITRPDVGDSVAAWAVTPGAVGVRLVTWKTPADGAADPGVTAVLTAAGRAGVPVCVLSWGRMGFVDELARAFPDTMIVVDHLGLVQTFRPPPPPDPFGDLDSVLALAAYPNITVKVTGACTLSHQPYPFEDLWEPLGRMFDTFGMSRLMWGTDWTRAVDHCSYHDAVAAFRDTGRISDGDRAELMGGTVQRVFGWSPTGRAERQK
jgi:predicted TIM-barrel fold metal-dependent hydrolase